MVKDLEDERERMRRELQKLREQIHVMHETQAVQTNPTAAVPLIDIAACSSDTDIFHSAGDLANIEVCLLSNVKRGYSNKYKYFSLFLTKCYFENVLKMIIDY